MLPSDKTHTKAMTAMTAIARSARPRWRFEERPIRITFDVFISRWSYLFSLAVSRRHFEPTQAISSMLLRDSPSRQAKLSYLIDWHHLTLVPHQSQTLSRPGCSVGICLPCVYCQGQSSWALPARIGISGDDNLVLTCRQIATVTSAFGKASHILAINRHDKAEIAPEVCDPVNEQMT